MPTTDDLSSYTMANDTKGFLLCYMQLVDSGMNLMVPTSLELDKAKDGWSEILPNVTGGYTDEFVDNLSQYWLSIIKKQGAKVTDTFAKEIIAIIENKPKPAAAQSKPVPAAAPQQQTASPAVSESAETPSSTIPESRHAPLDSVASHISTSYYSYQSAVETSVLPKDQLNAKIKDALEKEKTEDFLVYYLSFARYQEKVKVPMTSVISNIMPKWEEILMEVFETRPNTPFLKALSAKWFYLVNQKGLPTTIEKMQDILYFLMANRQESPESTNSTQVPAKTGGLISKLKSLFS